MHNVTDDGNLKKKMSLFLLSVKETKQITQKKERVPFFKSPLMGRGLPLSVRVKIYAMAVPVCPSAATPCCQIYEVNSFKNVK